MTGSEREALRRAVSEEKLSRVRRSGGWSSDREREEAVRGLARRLGERDWRETEADHADIGRLRLEIEALQARCEALERQRDTARRDLRLAESWIALAYGHTMVQDRPAPRRGYATEEARQEARRVTWRESKRRARVRGAA